MDFFRIPNVFFNFMTRRHIKEYFTTPPPQDNELWIYSLDKGVVIAPDGKELPYLHYLFFKKTPFWNPEHYWKDDFWQIDHVNFDKLDGQVVFDNQRVIYVNKE